MELLLAVIAALAAVAAFLIRTRYWELGPCPRCRGRRGRGRLSTSGAFNHWCRCGGSGERIRPLSLIWARHRREARRMRDEVRRRRERQR
jgi:hypothetical protein